MKISIKNFKSIASISDYEMKPLTILSGNNSSGKSSFIQLLLLLKQTIDLDSSKHPLNIDGRLYRVKEFVDIIREKNKLNKLEIEFLISKKEFDQYGDNIEKSIFDSFPEYTCLLNLLYDFRDSSVYIKQFYLVYTTPDIKNYVRFIDDKDNSERIFVESNNEYFVKGFYDDITTKYTKINYSSFFPNSYEVIRYEPIENPQGGDPLINEIKTSEYPNLDSIKSFFKTFFSQLSYIGPLRTEPQDFYASSFETSSVGTRGENVAQILEKKKDDKLHTLFPKFTDDGITFHPTEATLLQATNFWICNVFKFGKELYAKENGENYSIILVNYNDVAATIKHVGFGVSQILPIVVQGLILESGGTLILEQPEIHLHPKIQSLLFDFLYSLILQNKKIIIETHSDHFITRFRRRVAEDETNNLKDLVNLTFIENGRNESVFRTINLDEFGALTYFPEEFIERPDIELKALIKAQMKKRINKTDKE